MSIKEELADARRTLNAGLKGWNPPGRKLLPVDPAHAASCFGIALRHNQSELAQAAAKTLSLFAPHLLWNGLLTFAASETAMCDLAPTLAIMAAKQDQAWLRRKGGLSRVASYLIDTLVQAERSMDGIYLWRLSFDNPQSVPDSLRTMATQAQKVRRGILGLLGMELEGLDAGVKDLEAFDITPEGPLARKVCVAAFRQVLAGPVLMQPVLRQHFAGCGSKPDGTANSEYIESRSGPPGGQSWLLQTLTCDTPVGRKAIREIVASLPDLEAEIVRLGLTDDEAIEVIGELLERVEEEALQAETSQIHGLRSSSRWSGVSVVDHREAEIVGDILRANGPYIDQIRATYIPLIAAGLRLARPVQRDSERQISGHKYPGQYRVHIRSRAARSEMGKLRLRTSSAKTPACHLRSRAAVACEAIRASGKRTVSFSTLA